jgi:hypothetical protein
MINNVLEREEKAILLGMQAVLDLDICACFDCPAGGCDDCPLHAVNQAQDELMNAINKAVSK